MSNSQTIPLDWRALHADLEPYLEGEGGVLHVHASRQAPTQVFVDVLSSTWLERSSTDWLVLRVDPADETKHYPSDLLAAISRTLNFALPSEKRSKWTFNFANRARVKGDLNLDNIYLTPDGPKRVDPTDISALCDNFDRLLAGRKFLLIFTDLQDVEARALERLSQTLWNGGLDRLAKKGLLLVAVFDPASEVMQVNNSNRFPPFPDKAVVLSPYFDTAEARRHAIDDLVKHSLKAGWHRDPGSAHAYADGIINSMSLMKDLQAGLAVFGANKARPQ